MTTVEMVAARMGLAWAWARRESGRLTGPLGWTGPWMAWFLASSAVACITMPLTIPLGGRGILDAFIGAVGGFAIGSIVFAFLFQPHREAKDTEGSYDRALQRVKSAIPGAQEARRWCASATGSAVAIAWETTTEIFAAIWSALFANRTAMVFWAFVGPGLIAGIIAGPDYYTNRANSELVFPVSLALAVYEITLTIVVACLVAGSCPKCGVWMMRKLVKRVIVSKRSVTRWTTTLDTVRDSGGNTTGTISRRVPYQAMEVAYADTMVCKKCSHMLESQGTYDE